MKFKFFLTLLLLTSFPFSISFAEGGPIVKTTIRNQKFIPDEIHIKAEKLIIFQVVNDDSIPVEFESSDLNKEKIVPPGQTIDIQLKGLKPGVYEFFSDFGPKDLRGKIIIE